MIVSTVRRFVHHQQDRLEFLCLPPYSPRLNPIEKLWAYLRGEITHNMNYDLFEDIRADVVEFLCGLEAP